MKKLYKKLQLLSLVLIAGLLFTSVSLPVKAFIQKQGTVNESVVLRQNPDNASNQVMELTNGQGVTVNNELTGKDGAKWYQLFVNETVMGYVPVSSVTLSEEGTAPTQPTQPQTPSGGQQVETQTVTERIGTVTTGGAIRVRKEATTASEQVASLEANGTFEVISDVNAADGYVWHEINFDDNGTMVHGYVRSDLVSVKEVTTTIEVPVEIPTEPVPQEPEAPYSIASQVNAEGTTVWYLKDKNTGEAKEISSLMNPVGEKETGGGVFKAATVVLLIFVIGAAAAAVFFYMRWQDAEAFIDEIHEKQINAKKQQAAPIKAPAKAPLPKTPTSPVTPAKVVTPAKPTTPVTSAKPATPVAPVKPATPVTPVKQAAYSQLATPASQSVPKKEVMPNTTDIVTATKQELKNNASEPAKAGGWKSKNFLTDDDDLEFDFLDLEDK